MNEEPLNLTPEEITNHIGNSIAHQEYTAQLMVDFTDMRISRAQLLGNLYDFSDPNVLAHILGDVVTLIENVHIAMNPPPPDGFVSLTPKDNDGSEARK